MQKVHNIYEKPTGAQNDIVLTLKTEYDIYDAVKKYRALKPILTAGDGVQVADALKRQKELRGGEIQVVITPNSLEVIQ